MSAWTVHDKKCVGWLYRDEEGYIRLRDMPGHPHPGAPEYKFMILNEHRLPSDEPLDVACPIHILSACQRYRYTLDIEKKGMLGKWCVRAPYGDGV